MSELKKHADFSYCYLLKNTTKSIQRPGNLSQNSSARHARWPRRKKEPPSPFVSSPLQVTRCNYPELRKKKKKVFYASAVAVAGGETSVESIKRALSF